MGNSYDLRKRLFLYLICGIAAMAGLLFGYDTGVISGAILFIRKDFNLTDAMTEGVVSAVLLGAFLGSLFGGRVSDLVGRRKILIGAAITFVIGSLVSAISPNEYWLGFSRALLGLAIGISSFAAPLYLAEIAPFEIRGRLVSLNQLAITIGILASYFVDYSLASTESWRWMLGIGVFPALILAIGLIFLPESPRWMMMRGREFEARKTLASIRDVEKIEKEVLEIRESLVETDSNWRLLFSDWVRPILFLAVGLAFFQQATGINTFIYYAPSILQMAGFKQAQGAILATLGLGFVNVVATIIALPLIDRVGRRPILLGGLAGMGFSLFIQGMTFYLKTDGWLHLLSVSSMILYIISFAISLGPICWLVISEVFPLRIRGLGVSVASSINWASNFFVAITFLTMVNTIGPGGTFWVYSVLCIVAAIFIYTVVPETKGKSLEEIEASLRKTHNVEVASPSGLLVDLEIERFYKVRPKAQHRED